MLSVVIAALSFDPSNMHQDPDFAKFMHFVEKHRSGVAYRDEMETVGRFAAFKKNLKLAEERNNAEGGANNKKGGAKHGITKFMDLTTDEFRRMHTGFQPAPESLKKKLIVKDHRAPSNLTASSIDWNAKGALTPIKNQGQCGSCWAFSASEQLESDFFLQEGELKELSPQMIVSCDTTCMGCNGGNPINAWDYVHTYGGQDSKSSYPYTSGTTQQTGTCGAKESSKIEDVTSALGYLISNKPSMESNMLKQMSQSPMSIVVDAELWQTYQSGVITSASGCGTACDHAVQATGYNAEGNYWIIRNSWGTDWGNDGFVYVEYGANVCGLTTQAAIAAPAVVAKLK
jgi:C1A family cysteine protease